MKPRISQDADTSTADSVDCDTDANAAASADWKTDANATDLTGWEADNTGDAGFNENVPAIELTEEGAHSFGRVLDLGVDTEVRRDLIIPDAITAEPMTPDTELFKSLYAKAKVQHLNNKQQRKLEELVGTFAVILYKMADAVCCTSTQLSSKTISQVPFEHAMIDEAGIITEAELALVLTVQGLISVMMIGDSQQLGPISLTSPEQNPFHSNHCQSPFVRLAKAVIASHMLTECQRMVAGQLDFGDELFYDNRLIYGPGTSLNDRPVARILRDYVNTTFKVRVETEADISWPVMLQIDGLRQTEENGSSSLNLHTAIVAVQTIIDLLLHFKGKEFESLLPPNEIGVVTAYSAQVTVIIAGLRAAEKDFPSLGLHAVEVRTTTTWQGKERSVMIFDFVRAGNDEGVLGFAGQARRLNTATSRHRNMLIILADQRSVVMRDKLTVEGLEKDVKENDRGYRRGTKAEKQAGLATYNARKKELAKALRNAQATLEKASKRAGRELKSGVAMFNWFHTRGRIAPVTEFPQKYVKLPSATVNAEPSAGSGKNWMVAADLATIEEDDGSQWGNVKKTRRFLGGAPPEGESKWPETEKEKETTW